MVEASTPFEAARARARGETAPVARSVAKAGAACSGAAAARREHRLDGGSVATGNEAGDVLSGLTDDDERILDGDLVAFLPQELQDGALGGRGHLHGRLVGLDGRERLVDGDGVAFGDHPLDDDA